MSFREAPAAAPLLVFSTQVVALERASGRLLWEYPVGEPTRRFAIDGERVFVFDAKGTVHCIAIATGQLVGIVPLGLRQANNMLLDQGVLYLTNDDTVYALSGEGKILWRQTITNNGSWTLCGLAVPGGNLAQPDYSTS